MSSRTQRIENDCKAENKKESLPGEWSGAQYKNDRAEQSGANEKREEGFFPTIKDKRESSQQKCAERPGGGDSEQPSEQNGQNRQCGVHYRRNPRRVRMKPNVLPSCGET